MATRIVSAQWNGNLKEGNGTMKVTGYEGPFTFASRFESGEGTNPEELVGAAHAGCYSMFLSALLSKENITATSIKTEATVQLDSLDDGPKITKITLDCKASIPGVDNAAFQALATKAKENCPISKLFTGTEIVLNATLD